MESELKVFGRDVSPYASADNEAHEALVARLRESEARFRVLAEAAPVLIWMADVVSGCTYVNQRYVDFTGRRREQEHGTSWRSIVHPDDAEMVRTAFQDAATARREFQVEYRLRRADGEYRWILAVGVPRLATDGTLLGYVGSGIDITERKQAERARALLLDREQAARTAAQADSRAKDEFLALLSHELRTPLGAVLAWAELLQSRPLDEPICQRGLGAIARNARTLAQLIDDLLDVSRIVAGRLLFEQEPVDLRTVVDAALDGARPGAAAKGLALELQPATGDVLVAGDPHRLQQVATNLLANAVKFTAAGGRVEVTLVADGNHARLRVRDTGEGIASEFLPHVFDRFRQADASATRAHGGLGLGLGIVRHLVELHGGTVRAESEGAGQGATFVVDLPLLAGKTAAPPAVPVVRERALAGLRVLLVEDDADARDALGMVLDEAGAATTAVGSVAEAMAVLEHAPVDVLVSDIGLPHEDGYALVRRLRARESGGGATTPAIALTAYAGPDDRARALAAGFQRHVPKPVAPSDLLAAVRSVVARG